MLITSKLKLIIKYFIFYFEFLFYPVYPVNPVKFFRSSVHMVLILEESSCVPEYILLSEFDRNIHRWTNNLHETEFDGIRRVSFHQARSVSSDQLHRKLQA